MQTSGTSAVQYAARPPRTLKTNIRDSDTVLIAVTKWSLENRRTRNERYLSGNIYDNSNMLLGGIFKMSEERCVCCGNPVLEGEQVCRRCIKESEKGFIYVDYERDRYS